MEEKDKKSLIKTEIYYILYYTYDRNGRCYCERKQRTANKWRTLISCLMAAFEKLYVEKLRN